MQCVLRKCERHKTFNIILLHAILAWFLIDICAILNWYLIVFIWYLFERGVGQMMLIGGGHWQASPLHPLSLPVSDKEEEECWERLQEQFKRCRITLEESTGNTVDKLITTCPEKDHKIWERTNKNYDICGFNWCVKWSWCYWCEEKNTSHIEKQYIVHVLR